jgi:hypothetical protein
MPSFGAQVLRQSRCLGRNYSQAATAGAAGVAYLGIEMVEFTEHARLHNRVLEFRIREHTNTNTFCDRHPFRSLRFHKEERADQRL